MKGKLFYFILCLLNVELEFLLGRRVGGNTVIELEQKGMRKREKKGKNSLYLKKLVAFKENFFSFFV